MPIRPPRSALAVSAAIALVASAVVAPAPAIAAPSAAAPVQVVLGEPVRTSVSRDYGTGAALTIASGADTVVFDYGDATLVWCGLGWVDDGEYWLVDATPSDDPGVVELSVPGGLLAVGGRVEARCESRADGVPVDDDWVLQVVDGTDATARYAPAELIESGRWESSSYAGGGAGLVVVPDGTVEFVAEPGTAPVGGWVTGTMRRGNIDAGGTHIGLSGGTVPADGSGFTAVMPVWAEFLFSGETSPNWRLVAGVLGSEYDDRGVHVEQYLEWSGDVRLDGAPSSTRVAASSTIATSFQRVKAIIRVTAPDIAPEDWYPDQPERGAIVVKVDGRVVSTIDRMAGVERYVVTLPRLSRGTHRITAEYAGWTWIAPSTSSATVRILI